MTNEMTIEEFQNDTPKRLNWLEEKGFERIKELEAHGQTYSTLVYCGENVAFEFSLDIRDQCLDAEVISVKDGKLMRNIDGGYSCDIYKHLVMVEGYRGRVSEGADVTLGETLLDKAIDGWTFLLNKAGEDLLSDREIRTNQEM